jgi:hypothetical protein
LEEEKKYKNFAELLLHVIKERPGMFLTNYSIFSMSIFITGFSMSEYVYKNNDPYFGENGFLEWYSKKYKPKESSFWTDYFLKETKNDERKALELYFERLEEYYEDFTFM